MTEKRLDEQIIELGEKNKWAELRYLIEKSSINEITTIINLKLGKNDFFNFWNYLLQGFDPNNNESKDKRFGCVTAFLNGLQKVELSYKQTYDLITRLCQDLTTFTTNQLIEILEHSMDALRMGDPKCVSWKDLLPETLKALTVHHEFKVNSIMMSSKEYHDSIVRNLCTMKWPSKILTPIADMFIELQLNIAETTLVLNKFTTALQSLAPSELPTLAYQLFSMCSTATLIFIPILAFEKYFHNHYYQKLFEDMTSQSTNLDSIDAYSEKELREAEENILHHLNYCTQYKINEIQICFVMKNFQSTPDVILTPFVISALLSMSAANRDPDLLLLNSPILTFLRTVFKHNEEERLLAESSAWCRDNLRNPIDVGQLFAVLIDQNKDGKDKITPGLVNLAFILLKAKNAPELNALAIGFFMKFIKKRFIFGQGIIKKIAQWMITEQDQNQYAECLTSLSTADTFTVSECITTIDYVMDFFVKIPGAAAMRMMTFILPTLKLSPIIRDKFIVVLRKAINSCEMETRLMAVYGFCMILKYLNASNSQRSQLGVSGLCTQQSISGYSLMSQSSYCHRSNSQRNFDMLTLEIIGLLRNCFNESLAIKLTLYENVQRSVELNPMLVHHVLQFIDWHFRSYFHLKQNQNESVELSQINSQPQQEQLQQPEFTIHFDKLISTPQDRQHEIEVKDNLGNLIVFASNCLTMFEKNPGDYDVREIKRILRKCIDKVIGEQIKFENKSGTLTYQRKELLVQQLNLIEGLMSYVLLVSKNEDEGKQHLTALFKIYKKLHDNLQELSRAVKNISKKRTNTLNFSECDVSHITINGVPVTKLNADFENIWDLNVLEKCMHFLHINDGNSGFKLSEWTFENNCDFVKYFFKVAIKKITLIRNEPVYKQIAYSKRILNYLINFTKCVYESCIKNLYVLREKFDKETAILAVECFYQCLLTANVVFKKKFKDVFLKSVDSYAISNNTKECIVIIQEITNKLMGEKKSAQNGGIETNTACVEISMDEDDNDDDRGGDENNDINTQNRQSKKNKGSSQTKTKPEIEKNVEIIPYVLLQCLEILYDNITHDDRMTTASYTWLLHFTGTNIIKSTKLGIVNKLLLVQRQKTHTGAFLTQVTQRLCAIYGKVVDENDNDDDDVPSTMSQKQHFKSIQSDNSIDCLNYLYETLKKQIENVEYFIKKSINLKFKHDLISDDDRPMQSTALHNLERSICSRLIIIAHVLLKLTNIRLPMGACMDILLRLVMQYYVCLKNLTKHLITSYGIMNKSISYTKFDVLLGVMGKALPEHVYNLITYIEANIESSTNVKQGVIDTRIIKARILKETKLIPRIILSIENFHKYVIQLASKTSKNIASLLHYGVVRDFRIKTSELKAAIERTLSHKSQIEDIPSELNNKDYDDGDNEDEEQDDATNETSCGTDDESNNLERFSDAEDLDKMEDHTRVKPRKNSNAKNVNKTKIKDKNEKEKMPEENQNEKRTTNKGKLTKPTKEDECGKTEVAKGRGSTRASVRALNANNKNAKVQHAKDSNAEELSTPENELLINELSGNDVLENLHKINKNAKKRMLKESETLVEDPDVKCAEPMPKKLRGRSKKK